MNHITTLFCTIDDFFLKFESTYRIFLKQNNPHLRLRQSCISLSEIIFIAVWYKQSHLRNFKAFYKSILLNYSHLFKVLPCYEHMIYLINTHQLALHALHFAMLKHPQSEYLWIDSTTLPVYKNQRINRHKSLASIATRSKSSMGWFYGCKLHAIMNAQGEMVSTALSNGHIADLKMVEQLVNGLEGKLYGDRGYISSELKQKLQKQNLELITRQRKNMAMIHLSSQDEYHLKQRNKIETLFSLLKESYHLVTSKARSVSGYLAGMYASLCAYQLCHANKPKIAIYNEFP